MRKFALFAAAVLCVFAAGTSEDAQTAKAPLQAKEASLEPIALPAPIETMIGQMIAIGFDGNRTRDEWVVSVKESIKNGEIGSVVLYGRNVINPEQLENFVKQLHYSIDGNRLPLWVMIDQEGGRIERLSAKKGFCGFPSAKKVAQSGAQNAYSTYRNLACELRGYGINFNLAPVVDLDIDGSVIARDERSFSADEITAAKMAEVFIKAHNSCGILTAIKHFPGLGNALTDTHKQSADASQTYKPSELFPFKSLIENDKVNAVLVSHAIDAKIDRLPASLSKAHIDHLRSLGFDGVVITDDLQMGAIANHFDLNETVVLAVNAGSDILLFANTLSEDRDLPQKIRAIIVGAIENGEISVSRLIEAYNRIAQLKKKRIL
ncbi:glycosyl hydrolase [Campylobacterota bacterium]|nr:glycosyl hydrolase [Campylobacterota bacterium]